MFPRSSLVLLVLLTACAPLHDRRLGEEAAAREDWPAAYAAWARVAEARPGSARAQAALQTARTAVLAGIDAELEQLLSEGRLREAGQRLHAARSVSPPPAWSSAHADRIAEAARADSRSLQAEHRFTDARALLDAVGRTGPLLSARLDRDRAEADQAWSRDLQQQAVEAERRGELAVAHALLLGAARLEPGAPAIKTAQARVWSQLLPQLWGGMAITTRGPASQTTPLRDTLASRWATSPWRDSPALPPGAAPPPTAPPLLAVDLQVDAAACTQARTGTLQQVHRYTDGTFVPNPEIPRLQQALREANTARQRAAGAHDTAAQRAAAAQASLQQAEAAVQAQAPAVAAARQAAQAIEAERQEAQAQVTASREASAALQAREAEVRERLREQEALVQARNHLERVVLPPLKAAREAAAARHAALDGEARQTAARVAEARGQLAAAERQVQAAEAALAAAREALARHTAEQDQLRGQLSAIQQRDAQAREAVRTTAATLRSAEDAERTAGSALQSAQAEREDRQRTQQEARVALQQAVRAREAAGLSPEQIAALDGEIKTLRLTLDAAGEALRDSQGAVEQQQARHREAVTTRDAAREAHRRAEDAAEQAGVARRQAEEALQSGPTTGQERQRAVAEAERALRTAREDQGRAAAVLGQATQADQLVQGRLQPAARELDAAQDAEQVQRTRLEEVIREAEAIARRLKQLEGELGALSPSVALLSAREAALREVSRRHQEVTRRLEVVQVEQQSLRGVEAQALQLVEGRRQEASQRAADLAARTQAHREVEAALAGAPAAVELVKEHPYTVEQWERTCTVAVQATLQGGLGAVTRWQRAEVHTSRDESHPAFAAGGQAADPLAWPQPEGAVLDGLRDTLAGALWSSLEAHMLEDARTGLAQSPREGAGLEASTRDRLRVAWVAPTVGGPAWEAHIETALLLPPAP